MFDTHVPTHRVLIVDDESAPRCIEAFALEGTGRYYAMEAGNGTDALTMLSDDGFECAVIDLSMPDMNGIELISLIRRHLAYRDLPIVLVMPEGGWEESEAVSLPGPTHTITKPFDPWDLAKLLDKLTGALDDEGHVLSVETVLCGFPYPAMILNASHHVLLANGVFYEATRTGVSECHLLCQRHMHADGEIPSKCPLERCAETGETAEETVDTEFGRMRVSVYPLAIRTGSDERLYLHVTQPSDC